MIEPYYSDGSCTIYHADCREVLAELEQSDLLLTDPPYGIAAGAAFWRRNGTAIEDDGDAVHNAEVVGWRHLVQLASDAAVVEFCGSDRFWRGLIAAEHEAAGWTPWRPFMLVKSAPPPTVRRTLVSAWEPAMLSFRGKRPWYGSAYVPDRWIGLTPNRLGEGVHPTQKPIEPMRSLVEALSPIGGLVLDPFMGSGTSLRAAKDCGRQAIGIEVDERYCEVAVKRLGQGVLNLGA